MKGCIAFSCLFLLVLVLQASVCVARPQAERSLLAVVTRDAGAGCADGEQCSSGATTTADCPSGGGDCPLISAGQACKITDACSTGAVAGGVGADRQPCPADPDTKTGICPLVPAGASRCLAKDLCARSATTSGPCTLTSTTSPGTCALLAPGASCSSLAGACTPAEQCSSPAPVASTSTNAGALYDLSSAPGLCTVPKAAGARCATGTDLCRGQDLGTSLSICSGSTCPLIRPGAFCTQASSGVTADKCYDGSPAGAACTTSPCPLVADNEKCMAGDACLTTTSFCNAVGSAEGICVVTGSMVLAGASCTAGEFCQAANVTNPYSTTPASNYALACNTAAPSKCPVIPAGQLCTGAAACSDGSSLTAGPACGAQAAGFTPGTCSAIVDGGNCFVNDKCAVANQYCNAKGSTAGRCVLAKPAGQACLANDLCAPIADGTNLGSPSVCPDSLFCPAVPAGASCAVAVPNANAALARLADKCNNGNVNATIGTSDCVGANGCPVLSAGAVCRSSSDVCVKGSSCQRGLCQPNGKIFASTTTTPLATNTPSSPATTASTGVSTAAKVPSVSAVATLSNYGVANFTAVQTQYCDTIEANVLATYGVVSSCAVGTLSAGSVVVPTTVALNGEDATAATKAQGQLFTALKASDTSLFGTAYGNVQVSSVESGTTNNPDASGAATTGLAWTVGVAVLVSALAMTV